jgi:hypothetical protein
MTEIETTRPGRGGAGRSGAWVALAAAALALAVPARAAAVQGSGEVRLGLMHFDYTERDPAGVFLDGEKGWVVPAIVGEGELRGDLLFGRGMLRYAQGTVTYTGQVLAFPGDPYLPYVDGLPVKTDSNATFLQGELQGGVQVGPARQIEVFAGLGARRWNRDIQGTTVTSRPIPPGNPSGLPPAPNGVPVEVSPTSEVYTWYELQFGARWAFLVRPGMSWDVDGRLVQTLSPEVSGPFLPKTFSLGSTTGWRLGSTFRQDLNPRGRVFLSVNAYFEGYSFGASAVDPSTSLYEPDSSTVNFGLEVGVGGRF